MGLCCECICFCDVCLFDKLEIYVRTLGYFIIIKFNVQARTTRRQILILASGSSGILHAFQCDPYFYTIIDTIISHLHAKHNKLVKCLRVIV